jgi:hypothetical protein
MACLQLLGSTTLTRSAVVASDSFNRSAARRSGVTKRSDIHIQPLRNFNRSAARRSGVTLITIFTQFSQFLFQSLSRETLRGHV